LYWSSNGFHPSQGGEAERLCSEFEFMELADKADNWQSGRSTQARRESFAY
jgi:hypothetical protein